jgi:four helix bundle protein
LDEIVTGTGAGNCRFNSGTSGLKQLTISSLTIGRTAMRPDADQLKLRSKRFALRILKLCDALPKGACSRAIANQLVRSGTSVGANYRAVCRARSRAEFIAKIGIVVEEADETVYWLDLLAESELVKRERLTELQREACELFLAIFSASQLTAKGKAVQSSMRKSSIVNPAKFSPSAPNTLPPTQI